MKLRTILMLILAGALLLAFIPLAAVAWNGGHDALGSEAPGTSWYFAEGTTRAGFGEFVCILNPGDLPTEATLTYMLDTGENIVKQHALPARSRTTVNVGTEVPPGRDASLVVTAGAPVVAERSVYFTYNGAWTGGHDVTGAPGPRADWYFAEGCTRPGFDTYLCLQNPNEAGTTVTVRYLRSNGRSESREGIRIAPKSRLTIPVHDPGLGIGRSDGPAGDVSIEVKADPLAPVVAERPMYFSYGQGVTGGHDALGAAAPGLDWYFAEGCSRPGFDTYLCLANPGGKEARVDIEYDCGDGKAVAKRGIKVKPESRVTVAAHDPALGVGRSDGPHGDFSIRVQSANGVPLVAERPVYFAYRPYWNGGSDVVGASSPHATWYFAEGCTRLGFDTYLCIANPGTGDATVHIDYYCGDGQVEPVRVVRVAAKSRLTVAVHDAAMGIGRHDDGHGDVSIRVESVGGTPVVAERPMYFASRWRTIDKTALAAGRGWGEVFKGIPGRKRLALTFDLEGGHAIASQILDILAQRDVRCTLFVLGGFAAGQPDLLRRMAEEGHEIGNHSVSHSFWTKRGPAGLAGELATVEATVNNATGLSTRPFFRFPYGDRNSSLIQAANAEGYLSVNWSIDPQEWRAGATVGGVQASVLAQASDGGICLMHDKPITVGVLPGLIDSLRARGFDLVTLSELLYPGP